VNLFIKIKNNPTKQASTIGLMLNTKKNKDMMIQITNLKAEQIRTIYSGKDNQCRCGCAGTYAYELKLITSRLNKAKKLINQGASYNVCSDYINIESGENKAITIYLKN